MFVVTAMASGLRIAELFCNEPLIIMVLLFPNLSYTCYHIGCGSAGCSAAGDGQQAGSPQCDEYCGASIGWSLCGQVGLMIFS